MKPDAGSLPAFETCGVRIDAVTLPQAADLILDAGVQRRGLGVHLCNAYTLSLAVRDHEFARLLHAADLNLMDGMPLVWTAKRLGFDHIDDRVYGPDLMLEVMRRGVATGVRHHLYGGAPDVTALLPETLGSAVPGVVISGAESPPFRELTDADLVAAVATFGDADVVWVGLGTPKQDLIVERLRVLTGAAVVAVGAAFDFHAGVKRQAPGWMQRSGLEWAFRLITEPRRLWKRYLIGNTVFLWGLARTTRSVRR